MPTVVVYHDLPLAEAIAERCEGLAVVDADTEEETVSELEDAEIFVTNAGGGWSDAFLDLLESGDWVQATSAGYAVFPTDEFRSRGINFTNAAGRHGPIVSEHAFALAFALSRRIKTAVENQSERKWDRDFGFSTWEWKDKQLTIFGLGDIGEEVAKRGVGFGMDVYGVKRTPETYNGVLKSDRVVSPDSFDDLLSTTDLLVLTVPLNDETRHAIDRDVFEALPNSAVLVNMARGPVVDEEALRTALETGEIRGAGLDVFAAEPLPSDSPLWDIDTVVITPHIGGRSESFCDRFADLFAENYDRLSDGRDFINQIT